MQVIRYRCKACRRTFTVRPAGVCRSSKSLRVRALAVFLWCLGLSYQKAAAILRALNVPLCPTSAYNYVQLAGRAALLLHHRSRRGLVRLAGMDTTVYKVRGRRVIAAYVADALQGHSLAIEFLDKEDAESLARCLKAAVPEGLELLITDDAEAYKVVAEQRGVEHNLCQTHFKKAFTQRVQRLLEELPKDHPRARTIRRDLLTLRRFVQRCKPLSIRLVKAARRLLPDYLDARAPQAAQQASLEYRIRLLLTEIAEHGLRLFTHRRYKDRQGQYLLDGTDNVTERAIGLDGKIRYRAMRGAKSRRSLKRVLYLQAYIRRLRMTCATPINLSTLIA